MCIHIVKGSCALLEKCHCHPHHPEVIDLHPKDRRLIAMMQVDDPSLTVQECLDFIRESDELAARAAGYRFDVV